MQQHELALKAQEVEIKKKKLQIDAVAQAEKLRIEEERINAQKQIAGMQVGAKAIKDNTELQARMALEGTRLGVTVAQSHSQLQRQKKDNNPKE